ncbi:glycosyltransferase family A protein [Williamsia sp.]|uniref:glycosyltransferase family 2 protein n=1 Tax=Williamsia sp. TaxID=1872085 RepID=UPI002F91C8D3
MSDSVKRRIRTRPIEAEVWPQARVSVVVPCYNYAHFLPDAVSSALSQKDVDVDVIVVDDASTDESAEVAKSLASSDPRVRIIENQTNMGPVGTFNNGLGEVTGEFIVRLDADDMLTPGSLARSVALAHEFPSVGLVYGHPVHFIESEQAAGKNRGWGKPVTIAPGATPPYRSTARSWTVWPGRAWLRDRCRTGLNVITSPEVLMRASVVDCVGGQRNLPHTHDMEMWLRIASVSDVGHVRGADQAWHREHPRSLSTALTGSINQWQAQQLAFDTLFEGVSDALPEYAQLHDISRRAVAKGILREACHSYDRGRAEPDDVAAAEGYALELYPEATALWTWRALQRRKLIQDRIPVNRTPYIGAGAAHRLMFEHRARRWKRDGI